MQFQQKLPDIKGLISEVAGNADILLAPDLNAGNILYKSLNFLGGAVCAAIVAGASVPVVLTSRADSDRSKFLVHCPGSCHGIVYEPNVTISDYES